MLCKRNLTTYAIIQPMPDKPPRIWEYKPLPPKYGYNPDDVLPVRKFVISSQDGNNFTANVPAQMPALKPSKLMEDSKDGRFLSIHPILYLHTAKDGYITFLRKEGKEIKPLGSFLPTDLMDIFPEFRPWLVQDSYMSVNSMYAPRYIVKKTGHAYAPKTEKNLKYLNACYVDIDCGRSDDPDPAKRLPPEIVLAEIAALIRPEINAIPEPSMMAYSGRGFYLFWFLRDPDQTDQPQKAFSEKIYLYKQVNELLGNALRGKGIPADRIKDASRIMRTPGSFHTTAGKTGEYRIAEYRLWFTAKPGQPKHFFTLKELADFFHLPAIDARPVPRLEYIRPESRVPNRQKSYQALYQNYADDLLTLAQYRKGWKKGNRFDTLRLHALFLKMAGHKKAYILQTLANMAEKCHPAYPTPGEANDKPVQEIVNDAMKEKRHKFRADRLCKRLEVTDSIAKDLDLKSIVSPILKGLRLNEKMLNGRKMQGDRRRRLLADYLKKHPGAHTCRQMVKWLETQGVKTNYQTVNEELNAIGHKRTTGSPGRPRKHPYKS